MSSYLMVMSGIVRLILEIFIVGGTGFLGFVSIMYIGKKAKDCIRVKRGK